MKKWISVVLTLGLILSLTACASSSNSTTSATTEKAAETQAAQSNAAEKQETKAASKDVRTLKVATFVSSADILSAGYPAAKEKLEELSGGTLTFDVYYDGTLISMMDMLTNVGDGVADIGLCGMPVIDSGTHLNQIYSMVHKGGMPESIEELNACYWELLEKVPELQGELAEKNVTMLAIQTFPGSQTQIISREPFASVADLQGKTIQCSQTVVGKLVTALGGASVAQPTSEFYSALERGVTDGVYNIWATYYATNLSEIAHNYLKFGDAGISSGIMSTVMNLDTWNSLTEEEQGWLKEAFAIYSEENSKAMYSIIDIEKKKAEENGEVRYFSDEDMKTIYAAIDEVANAWIQETEALGYPAQKTYETIEQIWKDHLK